MDVDVEKKRFLNFQKHSQIDFGLPCDHFPLRRWDALLLSFENCLSVFDIFVKDLLNIDANSAKIDRSASRWSHLKLAKLCKL